MGLFIGLPLHYSSFFIKICFWVRYRAPTSYAIIKWVASKKQGAAPIRQARVSCLSYVPPASSLSLKSLSTTDADRNINSNFPKVESHWPPWTAEEGNISQILSWGPRAGASGESQIFIRCPRTGAIIRVQAQMCPDQRRALKKRPYTARVSVERNVLFTYLILGSWYILVDKPVPGSRSTPAFFFAQPFEELTP